MTLQEALTIAEQVQPKRPLHKLQPGTTADHVAAGVAALNKRYDVMGGTVAGIQKQLTQIEAGIARVEDHLNAPQPALPKGYFQ